MFCKRLIFLLIGLWPGCASMVQAVSTPVNNRISTPTVFYQNEEQICVCPTDSSVVMAIWRDFRLGYRQLGIGRSTDGGNTWSDSLINPAFQVLDWQSDPTMTVDADGNFYLCYLDFDSSAAQAGLRDSSNIAILKSTDKGLTWSGPTTVTEGIARWLEDKQLFTCDRTDGPYRNNLYLAWHRVGLEMNSHTVFARSIDGGASFDTVSLGEFYLGFPQPLVDFDGSVYIFGGGYTPSYQEAICFVKSVDGGQSFGPAQTAALAARGDATIEGNVTPWTYATTAADIGKGPFAGNIYLAYGCKDISNFPAYDRNIECVYSTDGGETWSEPVFVNDDSVGQGAMYDQFLPWLTCNEDGILTCIFYDQRTDSINHTKFDLFAAYSFDGGATFTTNHRISNVSIDPSRFVYLKWADSGIDCDENSFRKHFGSRAAMGLAEYIGCDISHDVVHAVWTDTREGTQSVYGAHWNLPLLPPRLISPLHNATASNRPAFSWATCWKIDADQYRLELAGDSLFTSLVKEEYVTVANADTQTVFLPMGTYYWRVKAFNTVGTDSSEYSKVRKLIVDRYVCGDASGDGSVNLLDILFLIDFVYGDLPGLPPDPPEAGDPNADGDINLLDILYLIDYLYGSPSGPEPQCP